MYNLPGELEAPVNPVDENLPVPEEKLPPLLSADSEWMLPAGHHPGQDPMEENLSAREDLLVPVPQAKHVWTTEN